MYIMIGLVFILICGFGAIAKYEESRSPVIGDWKQQSAANVAQMKQQSENEQNTLLKQFFTRVIAIEEYRLANDIPPDTKATVSTFIKDAIPFITFAGLFAIIVGAGAIANEFSWGTIKLLLIRPISRSKILLAKYVSVLMVGLFMVLVVFISAALVGLVLFGIGEGSGVHLAYNDGAVKEIPIILYLLKMYFYASISIFMLATMAFMISAVFRNSPLAIGISIFLLFAGSSVTNLLAGKYTWVKYSLFANTDLSQYSDGVPLVEGMTMGFSIAVLLIYFAIFHLFAFLVFTKRDVAA